jgi:hypothetical protein
MSRSIERRFDFSFRKEENCLEALDLILGDFILGCIDLLAFFGDS